MDDQRHTAAMSDADFDRELVQALAVDPSPAFVARVRTRIASEPAPRSMFIPWRVLALGAAAAAVVVFAVVVNRSNRSEPGPPAGALVARATAGASALPYLVSGFSRTSDARPSTLRQAQGRPEQRRGTTSSGRAGLGTARGEPVEPRAGQPEILLDPRETAALRSLLAGVRNNRVDLTPLLQPGIPAAMDLPPVENLVIAPIAIDPLAPDTGAQGERQ